MEWTRERDIGILVVGVGFLGAQRAAAATLSRNTQLVAVTDPRRDVAAQIARLHGAKVAADLQEGLKIPGVDVVVVATPHADHGEQVWYALEAGKHVLCEKPLAIDMTEAHALATKAQESGLKLATGFNHRFFAPVREALSLVDQGKIGRVDEVRARIGHRASFDFLTSWHVDINRSGGGALLDNGPHACDLIRCFLGEVSTAEGSVADRIGLPDGCESEAYARFRGRDGGFAELWSSWTQATGYLTLEVLGSAGHLRVETAPWRLAGCLEDGSTVRRTYLAARCCERFSRSWLRCDCSLVRELEAFASHLRGHGPADAAATGWDGCRATQMVQAVYDSVRTRRSVALEPLPVRLPTARPAREAIAA